MRSSSSLAAIAILLLSGCVLARAALGVPPGEGGAPNLDSGTAIDADAREDASIRSDSGSDAAMDAAPPDAWSDTGPPPCVPSTEACNLFDDDCDGATDEDTCGCERREVDGYVYQLCPGATAFDAWGRCTTLGAGYDLVVIDDAAEAELIRGWTSYEWITIGLADFAIDGTFVWTDGHTDTLDLFSVGEPNGHENENCVVTTDGKWLDVGCIGTWRYLCEGSARVFPPPVGTAETCNGHDDDVDGAVDEGACDCPTMVYDHHVYQVCSPSGGSSWDQAQADCSDAGGYRMGVVDDRGETAAIGHIFPGGSWLGLNDRAEESHFVWEGDPGTLVSLDSAAEPGHFVAWAGGEPNDSGGTHAENCVWSDGAGNWYDIACDRRVPYVCERAIAP